MKLLIGLTLSILLSLPLAGQINSSKQKLSYEKPQEYTIGGIIVSGTKYLDKTVLISLSGLTIGDKIFVPGDQISGAIKKLWNQGLFADIQINAQKIQGNRVFLEIVLEERPRLSRYTFNGMKKTEEDDLKEVVDLFRGKVVNENLLVTTTNRVQTYFINNGFLNAQVDIEQVKDTAKVNRVILDINVKKGTKVKIQEIKFGGVTAFKEAKLRRTMEEIKQKTWYDVFHTSKFVESNFEADKKLLIALYQEKGYRDAKITKDTIYRINNELIGIQIQIEEGKQYYFGDIKWEGNVVYSDTLLSKVLHIDKGDIFNGEMLSARLNVNGTGTDVSSLYLDRGYLFFSVDPVEIIRGDTIDYEMNIYEGKQAVINKVTVVGNTKTNDHVVMREIRTKPGQLFSYSDVIRTQRELAQLPYFNAEKLNVNPKPNPIDGTVDIEYTVEEQPSDQIELSGGFGANRLVGTLGLSFNNFSAKKLFDGKAWTPLPSGDGQTLSLRANSNGVAYQSYNFTFVEPWLGGKKPNAFSIGLFHSILNFSGKINITGASIGLGKRLKKPDNFFTLQNTLSYNYYVLENYNLNADFNNGYSNNLNYTFNFGRNSISHPIYPQSGSKVGLSVQLTPPWSRLQEWSSKEEINFLERSTQERYKWVEFHKWKFQAEMYTPLDRNKNPLVLYTKVNFGVLAPYNKAVGNSPFERFYIGGSGLTGVNNITGNEIIPLRGYADYQSWGTEANSNGGVTAAKYTAEVRFPFSLNPSATVFGLAFAEAGNNFSELSDFDPFDMKRSAGVGLRVFLPMFGLLGLDYGWAFDSLNGAPIDRTGQFTFTIGGNISGW